MVGEHPKSVNIPLAFFYWPKKVWKSDFGGLQLLEVREKNQRLTICISIGLW
jgi:hypothetical protein